MADSEAFRLHHMLQILQEIPRAAFGNVPRARSQISEHDIVGGEVWRAVLEDHALPQNFELPVGGVDRAPTDRQVGDDFHVGVLGDEAAVNRSL